MDKRYQDEILRLVNEQNDLYRDVTFDNVTMGLPRSPVVIDFSESGSYDVPVDMEVELILKGGGGGSGGSFKQQPTGRGGNGEQITRKLALKVGDTVTVTVGKGGTGGYRAYSNPSGRWYWGRSGDPGGRTTVTIEQSTGTVAVIAEGGKGGGGSFIDQAGQDASDTGNGLGGKGGAGIGADVLVTTDGNPGESGSLRFSEMYPDIGDRNTSVSLTGILNKGYRGSTDVYYRRHDLVALFEGMSQPELRTREITPQAIVDQLNVTYGLYLTLDEIANVGQFPTWVEGELEVSKTVELVVRDTAYGWVGSVTFKVLNGNPLLDDVVIVQLLPILAHPDDPLLLEGRRSGTLSTYEFDFTPWKERLQIDPASGYWANFADVQEIGKEAGLDYWYNNRVVDLPTSAVPKANPRFERVMVQQHAGGGVTGPLYFHYDQTW